MPGWGAAIRARAFRGTRSGVETAKGDSLGEASMATACLLRFWRENGRQSASLGRCTPVPFSDRLLPRKLE